jgi:hypothetical protein
VLNATARATTTEQRRGGLPSAPRDHSLLAWEARRTFAQWRAADEALRQEGSGATEAGHERAVAVALAELDRFGSVDDLIAHWFVDRYRRASDVGEPPAGTVEAWAREACRATEGGAPADEQVVAGAALWRRARALMGQALS